MKVSFKNKVVSAVQKRRENQPLVYANEVRRPFIDCLLLEMEEDEYLRDFFTVFDRQVQSARRARGSEYAREARKIHELVQKFAKERNQLVAKLRASGIYMTENIIGPVYDLSVFDGGTMGHERQKFDYTDTFNGAIIKKDMLLNPNDTTFKDEYEKQKKENVKRAERIRELKKQLRIKTIFGALNKEEREELKDEIHTLEMQIRAEKYYERDYRVFSSLSEGQRKGLIQYYEATEAIKKGVDAIDLLEEKFKRAKPPVTDPEVLDEAFDRMQADGMIEEDVERVMEKLDEIAQKRRFGFYEKKERVYPSKEDPRAAFIEEVYGFDTEKEKPLAKDNYDIDAFER